MRNVHAAFLVLAATAAFAAPVFADNDPSMQQIYDTANAGHVSQAQQMIDQVLRDHPRSAKAHYVAAELAAREGSMGAARSELGQAEQLDPGLPFAKPQAVQALKAELGARPGGGAVLLAPQQHSFPWMPVILLVGLVMLVWSFVRRRNAAVAPYPGSAYPGAPGAPMGAGPYAGPGVYGGPGAGGIGSGIAGGLASGLAVGAGVVAGEELARHFLDGDRHEGGVAPAYTEAPPSNGDMGGNDFGVDDTGGWDDSGGGGGGDWS
jgi:hypothetical protein